MLLGAIAEGKEGKEDKEGKEGRERLMAIGIRYLASGSGIWYRESASGIRHPASKSHN